MRTGGNKLRVTDLLWLQETTPKYVGHVVIPYAKHAWNVDRQVPSNEPIKHLRQAQNIATVFVDRISQEYVPTRQHHIGPRLRRNNATTTHNNYMSSEQYLRYTWIPREYCFAGAGRLVSNTHNMMYTTVTRFHARRICCTVGTEASERRAHERSILATLSQYIDVYLRPYTRTRALLAEKMRVISPETRRTSGGGEEWDAVAWPTRDQNIQRRQRTRLISRGIYSGPQQQTRYPRNIEQGVWHVETRNPSHRFEILPLRSCPIPPIIMRTTSTVIFFFKVRWNFYCQQFSGVTRCVHNTISRWIPSFVVILVFFVFTASKTM